MIILSQGVSDNKIYDDLWFPHSLFLQILELEEPISQMKIIHVAGTKGKVKMLVISLDQHHLMQEFCIYIQIWIVYRDQHACSLKLSYAIVAFALDSSHLLTSLMLEKDFNWMGEFSRFITLICSTFNCRRLFNFPNFGLFQ